MLLHIFISDLDEGVKGLRIKFAQDTKLGGIANILEDRYEIQSDLDTLEKLTEVNKV